MRRIYELKPVDGRKSFYGKAIVEIFDNGDEYLFSYNQPIMRRDKDGNIKRLYFGEWTQTTGRHIKAFCGMDKKTFLTLN